MHLLFSNCLGEPQSKDLLPFPEKLTLIKQLALGMATSSVLKAPDIRVDLIASHLNATNVE